MFLLECSYLSLCVYDAVAYFNIGASATIKVLEEMNIKSGLFCEDLCKDADRCRMKLANRKEEENSKKRGTILRGQSKQKSDKSKENEGDTYLPGGFYCRSSFKTVLHYLHPSIKQANYLTSLIDFSVYCFSWFGVLVKRISSKL